MDIQLIKLLGLLKTSFLSYKMGWWFFGSCLPHRESVGMVYIKYFELQILYSSQCCFNYDDWVLPDGQSRELNVASFSSPSGFRWKERKIRSENGLTFRTCVLIGELQVSWWREGLELIFKRIIEANSISISNMKETGW